MYQLTDEIYRLLKHDVLKIIDSCKKTANPERYDLELQVPFDYFAQSFVNPQDYFYFRFRRVFLKVVRTHKVYHLYTENWQPTAVFSNSVVTASVYLKKNLFGDFDNLESAVKLFYAEVKRVMDYFLSIPKEWEQLELDGLL